MLDLRIETFLCVCRYMNFTKAAQELNLTQPAVSQHIKFLEESYGVKLFEYNKKKLSLTTQGEYLKNRMQAIYHDTLKVKNEITMADRKKRYRIGATMSIGSFYLPKYVGKFIEENPDVEISLNVADTTELLNGLDIGQIDLAFVEGVFDKSRFAYKLLKNEEIICVASSEYMEIKHMGSKVKNLESLFSHRLLLRENGSGTREVFETALKGKGWDISAFKDIFTVNSPDIIRNLLLENVGISFVYSAVVADCIANGSMIKLQIPKFQLEHEFNSIWKKESIFADEFLSLTNKLIYI